MQSGELPRELRVRDAHRRAGASTPFTVPAGRVLVVTGFSWVAVGPPNATATVELRAGASAPLVRSSAPCDGIIGRSGGSEVLPTGAVIGAGAVVTKDVAPYEVVVGVPVKPIRKRFTDEVIEKLLSIAWWDWDRATLEARFDDLLDLPTFLEKYAK